MQEPVFMSERTDDFAEYYVVKDSGDDPDVTNHAKIYAGVRILRMKQNRRKTGSVTRKEKVCI